MIIWVNQRWFDWATGGLFDCPICGGQISISLEALEYKSGRKDKRPKECHCDHEMQGTRKQLVEAAKRSLDQMLIELGEDDEGRSGEGASDDLPS